jgi:hypothetical protein
MDSIAWQTYDAFSGSTLNTTLWSTATENEKGRLSTGAGGLTLTPTPLSSSGKNKVTIDATVVINNGAFFAAQVPFSIASAAAGSGGAVHFEIGLQSNDDSKWSVIDWITANNYSKGGTFYSGTFFASSTSANPSPNIQNTSVTTGDLGLIYSGGVITTYYNAGTGWQELGVPISTTGWPGPLQFWLVAGINNSGSITVVVPNVQYSQTAPAPGSLSSGWNLISLPKQPANTAIASVLSGLAGAYEVVWAYPGQTWQVYDPNDTAGSTLTAMQAGNGYWIKMTSAKMLSVSGYAPPASIPLSSGWNLVGYDGASCATASTALSNLAGGSLQASWGYPGQVWQFYDPANSSGNTLAEPCPGEGYWIEVSGTPTWTMLDH